MPRRECNSHTCATAASGPVATRRQAADGAAVSSQRRIVAGPTFGIDAKATA
jgi:hypothetical protein